jgi:hypothetical protein
VNGDLCTCHHDVFTQGTGDVTAIGGGCRAGLRGDF